jgi:magnesium-protoporphyrin IX monomethyl ester (oxidative) cyclase
MSSLGLSYGEPLGLAYVAAAIEASGRHQVEILDSVGLMSEIVRVDGTLRIGLEEDGLFSILSKKRFDAIGVTITKLFSDEQGLVNFFARLKRKHGHVPIIAGGPEATLEWRKYVETGNINFVVLGEGEETIVNLLDALSGDKDVRDVRGIAYRDSDGSIVNNGPGKVLDIAKIPWPARHLLPMDNYFRFRPAQYFLRRPAAAILTSRACPYCCVFCNLRNIWGNKWRGRTPNDVVNEIQHLVDEYGVREILIQDSNFIVDSKRAEAICDEIIRRRLDISFQVQPGLAIWQLNKDLLKKLRDSGLYTLCAQVETGNEKTVKYINKNIDFEHAREIMKYANRIGLWTQTNIIIGFHFETKEDIEESIRMAESLHVDHINYIFPILYEHTNMYEDYLREGLIDPSVQITYPVATHHLTSEELVNLQKKASRLHYVRRLMQVSNPIAFFEEIWPKVNSIEKTDFLLKRIVKGG